MILGYFHRGSGLGNQLHRYVATRVLAEDKGYEWGMFGVNNFKGSSFMNIDLGKEAPKLNVVDYNWTDGRLPESARCTWQEKKIEDEFKNDIRGYDPEFNFIEDDSFIDGEFQDERYWAHRESDVNEWLKVEPIDIPDDVCVIGFRGGEFSVFPDLFLPVEYWLEGVNKMLDINPNMRFEVHTDDEALARQLFPDYKVIHDIGINWRSMRYAKHAIIANSSFYILPRWLRNGITIAPRYWARHNTKTWALSQNYYKRFQYI